MVIQITKNTHTMGMKVTTNTQLLAMEATAVTDITVTETWWRISRNASIFP